ncbi:hypothetical protein [Sphaerisporangium fuscum]|uniref:hypothetical protein n=1 Tax=Sphaerisporangium fuscum TaxID=2835868 RepID=UPI001BDC822A|nr:hypothetical protein [Sphaerisporangium fuscum]
MPRLQRHSLARMLVSASLALPVIFAVPLPARAGLPSSTPAAPELARRAPATGGKPKIAPVPEVVAPPDAKPVVAAEGLSPAAAPVPVRPVGPRPPAPTTPEGPALVDKVTAEATARLSADGLVEPGRSAPDPGKLLPETDDAEVLAVSKPAAGLLGSALAEIKNLGGTAVPENVPLVTYRLCAETASVPVACSVPQPLLTPVAADLTGDGTPDLLANLVPAPGRGAEASTWPTAGLTFATVRLPGGDTRGRPLKAQVWAQYDFPASTGGSKLRRLSIGFDGLRRGTSLSHADRGLYRVEGKADVRVEVHRSKPGASVATIAGIADLVGKRSADPKVISIRQSPVPEKLTASARFDGAKLEGTLKASTSGASALDALVLDDEGREQRFTQVVMDRIGSHATAELTRRAAEGAADIHFAASAPIGRAKLYSYLYRDGRLGKVAGGTLTSVPKDVRVRYESVDGRSQALAVTTSSRVKAVDVVYFDRATARTLFRAALADLPSRMRIYYDITGNRVTETSSSKIGGIEAVVQRDGGAVATPAGSHVTMIKDGGRLGLSARLPSLAGFDVTYGAKPHAVLKLASAGRPFHAAASVDGRHLLQMDVSNTPRQVEVELDPAGKKARYRANGTIARLRAAYADTANGPTVDTSLYGVRSAVEGTWRLGDRTTAEVTTASGLDRAELYASPEYVTSIAPAGGEDVHATVRGVHRHIAVDADLAGKRLSWTADKPVRSVEAFVRAGFQGRHYRLAARADGVPARFEAGWGDGAYTFRGVSGPIGSAAIAVTNHDGARAPAGPHLAAHYDQATGDLDASVRVNGLTAVDFGRSQAGFKAGFQASRQVIALDADVTLAGDLRFGALGTLGPVPGGIEVAATPGGPLTYSSSGGRMDLKAEVWLGKAAAIKGISGVPAVTNGVSLADGGCTPGLAGCGGDQSPFCTLTGTRRCFGLRGYVALAGLPSTLTVDPARRTFAFSGYRPKSRTLDVYLDSRVLAPVPLRARATLDGLPRTITGMTLGPFEASRGKDAEGRDAGVLKVAYRVEPAATITSLKAVAEAGTGDGDGVVRARAVVDPVPAAVAVDATYGKRTHVRVQNSAAVRRLTAEVTVVPPGGRPGSGVARFTDVPAGFTIDADAASGAGLRMPGLTYRADDGANTLDGLFAVEGALVSQVYRPRQGELLDASFAVRDLASDTAIRINPDMSVELASKPVPTKLLEAHAGLSVAPVARQQVSVAKDIPYTKGFLAFKMNGAFGLGQSTIDDVSFGVHGMSWLRIRPGKVPFGMRAPGELGYVSPGFEGRYDHLDIRAGGVDLKPDVNLDVRIARSIGDDAFKDTLKLGPAKSLEFRRYDQRERPISGRQGLRIGRTSIACVTIDTRPGFASADRDGSIRLRGADGPQMVSLLDPGGQVQGYALDLLTQFMSPFTGAGWKVSDVTAGRCR